MNHPTPDPDARPVTLDQVDAFADGPFTGNPAAVCLLHAPADAGWMQRVAAEMNLSETAFVVPAGDAHWQLRWFTPRTEVDLCGHATLAAAHVLWERGRVKPDREICFQSASGPLIATRAGTQICLDFPADPPEEFAPPPALARALGVEPVWVGRNRMDWVVEVADAGVVEHLAPDVRALEKLDARGIMVTAPASAGGGGGDGNGWDFVSRFFAPAAGIDEDPVTGSAHCCLGPLWAARLAKARLVGRQLSARGGTVGVEVNGDRVTLTGTAVTVWSGVLRGATAPVSPR